MIQAIGRNAAVILGLVAAGFICARAAPYLISSRGDDGPCILWAQSPVAAFIAVLVCFALALLVACIVGRAVNAAVGLFVLGGGLFVLDGRLDTIEALALSGAAASPRLAFLVLAIETLLWAGLCLLGVLAMFRMAGPLRDVEPDKYGIAPHPLASAAAFRAAAAGLLVLPAVMIIGKSHLHGQMIGATFLGAMVAGLVGRLISPHVQPILLFISPIVAGAIGYVFVMIFHPGPLDAAFYAGTLPGLSLAIPLDYAAGSLMGVAVGLGWAKSFLHHEEPQETLPAVTNP